MDVQAKQILKKKTNSQPIKLLYSHNNVVILKYLL